jgi:hypothetical protein
MGANCCDVVTACGDECDAYDECTYACALTDSACFSKCATAHPTGVPQLEALSQCYDAKCKSIGACTE